MPTDFLGQHATWFEVHTPLQAQLLSSSKALYHLAPFMGRSIGTAQAARRAGVSTERMMYWVKRFVAAGLLTAERKIQPSRGRPIQCYAAPSAIKIPFGLTPFEDLSAQLSAVSRFYEELRIRATARIRFGAGNHYRYLYVDQEKGTMNLEHGPSQDDSAPIENNLAGVLYLPPATAKQLEENLTALLHFFEGYSTPHPGTAPYLLMGAFVALDPVQDAHWLRDFTEKTQQP